MENVLAVLQPAPSPLLKQKKSHPVRNAALLAMLIAAICFLPNVIGNAGILFYCGDYNAQQLCFYQLCHDAVRSGALWDWNTDLGANFIGSYSFYTIGSPFFWLTLPFPSEILPYLMYPLYILKFGVCAFTASLFLKRFLKTPQYIMLGGLLYAMSGFSMFNTVFFHFHDVMALFPLLLLGLELFVMENKRVLFAVMVGVMALLNFFFFFGEVVFVILYFCIRCTNKEFRSHLNVKKFLLLAFESVLGVLLAAALLLPSVCEVLLSPRSSSFLSPEYYFYYQDANMYGNIIRSIFMMPDILATQFLFKTELTQFSSLSAWVPVFAVAGIVGFCVYCKNKNVRWVKWMLLACLLCAFIPVLNVSFTMFNAVFYARWYFMAILMMVLATMLALEDESVKLTPGIAVNIVGTVIVVAVGLLFGAGIHPGTTQTSALVIWLIMTVAGWCALIVLARARRKNNPRNIKFAIFYCIAAIFLSWFSYIYVSSMSIYECSNHLKSELMTNTTSICMPDAESAYYRTYIATLDELPENYAMVDEHLNTSTSFQSVIPGAVFDFQEILGHERGVISLYSHDDYAAMALLSTKYAYVFDSEEMRDKHAHAEKMGATVDTDEYFTPEEYGATLEEGGFVYVGDIHETEEGCIHVYENTNYIPLGHSYSSYITRSELMKYPESERGKVMLKTLVVQDDEVALVDGILPHASKLTDTTYANYVKDCKALQEHTVQSFAKENNAFSAVYESEASTVVYFSIPYDAGWSASVNGQPVDIIRANEGFVGVVVPAGTANIQFTYQCVGFMPGVYISVGALLLLGVYIAVSWLTGRRRDGLAVNIEQGACEILEPSMPK